MRSGYLRGPRRAALTAAVRPRRDTDGTDLEQRGDPRHRPAAWRSSSSTGWRQATGRTRSGQDVVTVSSRTWRRTATCGANGRRAAVPGTPSSSTWTPTRTSKPAAERDRDRLHAQHERQSAWSTTASGGDRAPSGWSSRHRGQHAAPAPALETSRDEQGVPSTCGCSHRARAIRGGPFADSTALHRGIALNDREDHAPRRWRSTNVTGTFFGHHPAAL